MTRVFVLGALVLAIGCGVKGPPVRSVDAPPAEAPEAKPEPESEPEEEEE